MKSHYKVLYLRNACKIKKILKSITFTDKVIKVRQIIHHFIKAQLYLLMFYHICLILHTQTYLLPSQLLFYFYNLYILLHDKSSFIK